MLNTHHYRVFAAVVFALSATGQMAPAEAASCVTKAGSATGLTRGFAEYEAFLIIRQVTGNWPIQSDRISKPSYQCSQKNLLWTCFAKARVCKN